ncbi:MAG TPA: hypothetical protein VMW56_31150 [Candidatus Margulisiibacteriota bacterium]|nr:hypothetical protein [Candidatus Margulisiibacteriota bacterium]
MRYVSIVGSGVLLSAALFTSCTCHKEVGTPPSSTFQAPPSGFHVSGAKVTPRAVEVVKATPVAPPTPQAQAAEAKPTPNMPSDFPPDVPLYKDAALAEVQDLANSAHNVIFRTADPIPNIFRFYQDQMVKNGWQMTQQIQRPTHAFISFKKGAMVANLTVAEDVQNPGKQVIAIMYEQEKPLDFEEF